MENNFNLLENILCLILGMVIAVAILATICGDGNLGLVDLWQDLK